MSTFAEDEAPGPRTEAERPWAHRLAELADRLRELPDGPARREARGDLWLLLSAALQRFARGQARGFSTLTREDVEDLVAAKALDLVRRLESGALVLRRDAPHDVAAFLARSSRNALLDLHRRRRVHGARVATEEGAAHPADWWRAARPVPPPSNRVELGEVTRALEECLTRLAPRARRIWIFRTFFEMSSRDIARHPEIELQPEHVDVLVGRVRTAVRRCLGERGFDAPLADLAGLARLWDRFVRPDSEGGLDS